MSTRSEALIFPPIHLYGKLEPTQLETTAAVGGQVKSGILRIQAQTQVSPPQLELVKGDRAAQVGPAGAAQQLAGGQGERPLESQHPLRRILEHVAE